jgi:hypothetical protein
VNIGVRVVIDLFISSPRSSALLTLFLIMDR